MAVKIGHASSDENKRASGGQPGDQTGAEVCTRSFYMHKKGWIVLRAKDSEIAEKIARCMEDICENDCIGYNQSKRLTLYNAVKNLKFKCDINTLKVKVECDCSSAVRVCLAYAGVMVSNFTTSNEKAVIMATELFEEIECKSDGSNLKRGDILVTKTKGHTAVVVSNTQNTSTNASSTPTLKITQSVKSVQTWLNTYYGSEIKKVIGETLKIDGVAGAKTKKALAIAFQVELNKLGAKLDVDGLFGTKSQTEFDAKVGSLKKGSQGIFVTLWQCTVVAYKKDPNGIDGQYGANTIKATNALFKLKGLSQDSIVNGADVNKLL